jgi:hypothetical protein
MGARIARDRPGTSIVEQLFRRGLVRYLLALRRRGISTNRAHVSRKVASTAGERAAQQYATLIPPTVASGRMLPVVTSNRRAASDPKETLETESIPKQKSKNWRHGKSTLSVPDFIGTIGVLNCKRSQARSLAIRYSGIERYD